MSVISKKIGALEYLYSEQIPVPHCFTTRFGGVSTGIFESLNIGFGRGDECVPENYKILEDALGFSVENLVLSHQVHSDIILRVGQSEAGAGITAPALPECDALITNTPGIGLVVFTADCTPVLLWDSKTGAVGAVHAGWRGTALDIAGKTVRAMVREFGCNPANLRGAIGPNIGQCCFETDADVPKALEETYGLEIQQYIRKKQDKYYVNLKAINALALRRSGVQCVDISEECTMCQPDRFWSHRRTGQARGSQGAVILCKEGKK